MFSLKPIKLYPPSMQMDDQHCKLHGSCRRKTTVIYIPKLYMHHFLRQRKVQRTCDPAVEQNLQKRQSTAWRGISFYCNPNHHIACLFHTVHLECEFNADLALYKVLLFHSKALSFQRPREPFCKLWQNSYYILKYLVLQRMVFMPLERQQHQ